MIIAQISDCHIVADGRLLFGRVATNAMLERAIASINARAPAVDAIVATGDLVESGKPAEYECLRAILTGANAPVYLLPGNHDDRAALRAAFPDHGYLGTGGPVAYAIDRGAYSFVALDTTVPGAPHGAFDEDGAQRLTGLLDPRRRQTVLVFTHHPPFATGIWWMDAIGVKGGRRFADVIRRYDNIERVACGHIHRSIARRWAGTVASVAPSTAHQLALDLADTAFLGLTLEPAGYDLHVVGRNRITTHTVAVGTPEIFSHVTPERLPGTRAEMERLKREMAPEYAE